LNTCTHQFDASTHLIGALPHHRGAWLARWQAKAGIKTQQSEFGIEFIDRGKL
jgi:hypothetical protein